MKNLKTLMFGILLVGMHLTSCKKDATQQLQQDARAQNTENLFEKSVRVYNVDKTSSTTLRFRAVSKEVLDKMPNVEFTLVQAPEAATEATERIAPTISSDEGLSGYFRDASLLPQGMNKALPKDAVQIELPSLPSVRSAALEVTSKDESVAAAARTTFYFVNGYHRIQVTNRHPRPIIVDFYSFARGLWRNYQC